MTDKRRGRTSDNRYRWIDRAIESVIFTGTVVMAVFATATFMTWASSGPGSTLSLFWHTVIACLISGSVSRMLMALVDWRWPFTDDDAAEGDDG